MNFDNLKDAWANDKTENSHLSFNSIPEGKTSSVVWKIRRNMKIELIGQTMAFICLIVLFLNGPKSSLSVFIFWISTFLLLMQTFYYFIRFYVFYKQTGRYDLTVKKSIHKIIYELELNIEIFKTFNYCAFPLVILIIIGDNVGWVTAIQQKITNGFVVNYSSLLLILLILIANQIIFMWYVNLHIRFRYGRYLKELKKIMEDLESGE